MNKNELVWYACYGSNLLRDRFYCYIKGGTFKGNTKDYLGCTNKSLPLKEKSIYIPHDLYFAKQSKSWNNGGVAFIRTNKNENVKTLGRIYLITKEQFSEIIRQETNYKKDFTIDFELAESKGHLEILDKSWYGNIIFLGDESKCPIFTFTNIINLDEFSRPSVEYLKVIMKGIISGFKLNTDEIVKYLINTPGIFNNYKAKELEVLINDVRSE